MNDTDPVRYPSLNSTRLPTRNQPMDEWQGLLDLNFAHEHGKTGVCRSQTQAPLKFQRPFYPEGEEICHGVMLHTAGGIVGGDRLSLNIHLGESAQALLSTAAATKVYRSSGATSVQSTQITLADQACLEWFPQETILFNGANFHQHTRIELAQGSIWLGWEVLRLGRSARGEQFQTGEWRSHTEVWRQDRPLWIDRQFVKGGGTMLQNRHGLAGCPVVGSFVLVGPWVSPEVINQIREEWSKGKKEGDIGITRLQEGLLSRYRGKSTAEARQQFLSAWDIIRQSILNRSPHRPRIWSI